MLISKYVEDSTFEKISELEKKYDIVLCHDYKDFLMKYNGGETPKTNLSRGKVKTDIRRFYGFTEENQYSDLRFVLDGGLGEELISKFRLPIATNSFGDYFVIIISEEKNGEITLQVAKDEVADEVFNAVKKYKVHKFTVDDASLNDIFIHYVGGAK